MEKYLKILETCPLFAGIGSDDVSALLRCHSAVYRSYEKNSFIFMSGEKVTAVGVVLSGGAHIIREDFWGRRIIIARVKPGELFGEAFSCSQTEKLPVSVLAAEASDVMFIDYRRIVSVCPSACAFHTGLIRNMLGILAQKNVMLTRKIEYLTQRTTREKLLAYLSEQARQTGSKSFEIPFNRQELADYLSVDRSAMSAELSKMRGDGLLAFSRKRFELI